jgi:hypothetical protein
MVKTSLLLFLISITTLAQSPRMEGEWGKMSGKIEQLEKIKLIEELDLSEETTLRFFARRNEHRDGLRLLLEKKKLLYSELSDVVNSNDDSNLKENTDKILQIEEEMILERKKFIESLHDILTEKQIAQLVLFEFNFRKEMRHQFMKQRMKRMHKKNLN